MHRPPRAVDRPIVTGFGIWRIVFVGLALLAYTLLAFFWMKAQGASDGLARTVAVNAITIGQVFYLLNSRYLLDSSLSFTAHAGNAYLPLGIIAVVILQLIFTYAPPVQAMFGNEAVPLWVWPWLLAGGLLFFLVVEAEKLIIRSSGSLRKVVVQRKPARERLVRKLRGASICRRAMPRDRQDAPRSARRDALMPQGAEQHRRERLRRPRSTLRSPLS